MSELAAFQDALARLLLDGASAGETADPSAPAEGGSPNGGIAPRLAGGTSALAVYRNTVVKALVDALAANYPTVRQLVGVDWFGACATTYARAHPPTQPMLALYGEGFAEFLSHLPPASALAYLPDVARIDRLWTESHTARDARPLSADALARSKRSELFERVLTLHPAVRFGWFGHSAVTIWLHHRSTLPPDREIEVDGRSEGIVLSRPYGAVEWVPLDPAAHTFLARLRAGAALGDAAVAALEVDSSIDLASLLARLIGAGVFTDT